MRPRTLMCVLAALSLASLVVWVMGAAAAERGPAGTRSDAARPGGPSQPGRRAEPGTLVVGQPAPDFELPRLAIEKDKDGNLVGKLSQEKVKLSSLRGKKPVCLFLSSYT